MAVAQSLVVLLGTDETTGVTVTDNTTSTSSESDLLAGVTSMGFAHVYLKYTCGVAAGTVTVAMITVRTSGQNYAVNPILSGSFTPINGTEKRHIGTLPVSRIMAGSVQAASIGGNLTNVLLAVELFKIS